MVGKMVDSVGSLHPADVSSVPTIQNRPKSREHRRVVPSECEPDAAILVSRSQPAVAHEPTEDHAEFARPFGWKVENRRLPVSSYVNVRRLEGECPIVRELSLPRLNQEFVESWYQVLDRNPSVRRQDLVIRRRRQLESGFRRNPQDRLHAGAPRGD